MGGLGGASQGGVVKLLKETVNIVQVYSGTRTEVTPFLMSHRREEHLKLDGYLGQYIVSDVSITSSGKQNKYFIHVTYEKVAEK